MYDARVLEVLIASPSDVPDQREAIRDTVIRWNATESRYLGIVVLPVMWETHAYPDLSPSPQASINVQVVKDADILLATFWTTLGTPTTNARSGTVEEIERFVALDRHVCLYFCNTPVIPTSVDPIALESLNEYREEVKSRRLFRSYATVDQLKAQVRDDLTRIAREIGGAGGASHEGSNGGSGHGGDAITHRLSELQTLLRGYLTKWKTIFQGLENDYVVQKRISLASEIRAVTLEVVRLASEVAPSATFVTRLSAIAIQADSVASIRVYMDGGMSFGALTEGCRTLIREVEEALELPWESLDVEPDEG